MRPDSATIAPAFSWWRSAFKNDDEQIRVLIRSSDSAQKIELYGRIETQLRFQFSMVGASMCAGISLDCVP
jgi:hypothetical protein